VNINQAFPSKYFKSEDLAQGESRALIISECKMEYVGQEGEKENRPVLYFSNAEQGLVLNQTRAGVLSTAFGIETDNWPGQTIYIQRGQTRFGNKIVPCVDVVVPQQVRPGAAPYNLPPVPHTAVGNAVQGVLHRAQQRRPAPPAPQGYDGPSDDPYDPLA
jgi:hypothetical protein